MLNRREIPNESEKSIAQVESYQTNTWLLERLHCCFTSYKGWLAKLNLPSRTFILKSVMFYSRTHQWDCPQVQFTTVAPTVTENSLRQQKIEAYTLPSFSQSSVNSFKWSSRWLSCRFCGWWCLPRGSCCRTAARRWARAIRSFKISPWFFLPGSQSYSLYLKRTGKSIRS